MFDRIHGLSPTISIEQKSASNNPRSTVGTITEISDYLRVLFARAGRQHCPSCGKRVTKSSAQAIVKTIRAIEEGTRFLVLAPVIENRKGEFREILDGLRREGLVRVRVNGDVLDLSELKALNKRKKHTVEVVVDRLVAGRAETRRVTDSVETALRLGQGRLIVSVLGADKKAAGQDRILSEKLACEECSIAFPELAPQRFSFNSPLGMCVECNGLGTRLEMDPDLFVANEKLTISQGAIRVWQNVAEEGEGWGSDVIRALAEAYGFDLDTPFEQLTKAQRDVMFYGTGRERVPVPWQRGRRKGVRHLRFEGLVPSYKRRLLQTRSEEMKAYYSRFLSQWPCEGCEGARLRVESRHVRFGKKTFVEVHNEPIDQLAVFFDEVKLNRQEKTIASELLKELRSRLRSLVDVGLSYLNLGRLGPSLSGGEAQRIRLASQIGSELTGVVYVLDEPSIGLHQRDNQRLLGTLKHLRDLGNSVIVVEHDRETLEEADHLLDFGPGAGVHGGQIVAQGTPAEVERVEGSLTGDYLSGRKSIPIPLERRVPDGRSIEVIGAAGNNLKAVDATFPVGCLTCVTGVSGAGKSTLVNQILLPALRRKLHPKSSASAPSPHEEIRGLEVLDKVIEIDQQPIGRTPRSNPATYVKLFDSVRDLFASLPGAKMYGYKKGRFSFNVKGGRCEACQGGGQIRVEMHFLADVFVTCDECNGRRFNDATLMVKFKGYSISDVLDLTVAEAHEVFQDHPR
ncbi:MAG: excinuclease ABC subunit UvrA, partial [Planctomycetota bacterium]